MSDGEWPNAERCPHCGSDTGYYVCETVRRRLLYKWDGTSDGASEEVGIYSGKVRRCIDCGRAAGKVDA